MQLVAIGQKKKKLKMKPEILKHFTRNRRGRGKGRKAERTERKRKKVWEEGKKEINRRRECEKEGNERFWFKIL